MKHSIIFSAIMTVVLAGVTSGQAVSKLRLSFSEEIAGSGVPTGGTVVFTGLENPDMRVYEAIIPATTESECFASKDFSSARPVGPDRASLAYDSATGLYKLKWTNVRDKRDSCRVLIVGRSGSTGNLADWQSNYGAGGFAERELSTNGLFESTRGDGSVRPVRHQISLNPDGSPATLSVVHPAQDNEVITAAFPDSPDRNFVLFETVPLVATESECLAATDFSSAVPADPNRASAVFDPQSAVWLLRNSNSGSVPPCHVLLADGDGAVNASDYAVWRSSFGTTLFAESVGGLKGSSIHSDSGAVRTRSQQTTYAFSPVLQDQ